MQDESSTGEYISTVGSLGQEKHFLSLPFFQIRHKKDEAVSNLDELYTELFYNTS